MFLLVFSYGISTTLLQILISLRFPIHPSKGVHWCSRKRLFELSEASVHIVQFFSYALAGLPGIFPKSFLEQLFCREPVSACFCKTELHSTRYLINFPKFKKMQGKVADCNLKTCNLLKKTT